MTEHGLTRMSGDPVAEVRARFEHIKGFQLRFWLNGHWLESWFASYVLPEAFEVTLDVEGYGSLQRVLFVTGET
jgi:type II secretion system protein J